MRELLKPNEIFLTVCGEEFPSFRNNIIQTKKTISLVARLETLWGDQTLGRHNMARE